MEDQVKTLMKQVSQLTTTNQNYINDYNWEKGWVPGGKPEHSQPILTHDGTGRVNTLGIDALLDQPEWPEGDWKRRKLPSDQEVNLVLPM